jgi:BirA family transcriptional regulator, biotin operon repressor / biotin---[acetyl-CoA-carboxylase] ligase
MNLFEGFGHTFVLVKNSDLLSQTPAGTVIGKPFIILSSVDSTNNYAMAKLHAGMVHSGTAFFAIEQFAGKGQRSNHWHSTPGNNIILSIITVPPPKLLYTPFAFSALTALACYDLFKKTGLPDLKLKWPNDLYYNDRKAGGILIENVISGSWKQSAVGIGINVNERFNDSGLNATSLSELTNSGHDPVRLAKQLCELLDSRISTELEPAQILSEYNHLLFGRNQVVRLKKDNIVFETTVKEVLTSGELLTEDNIERQFNFGQVQWLSD